jgi:hypothetical protein
MKELKEFAYLFALDTNAFRVFESPIVSVAKKLKVLFNEDSALAYERRFSKP